MTPHAGGVQSATAEGGSWRGAMSDDFSFKNRRERYAVRDDDVMVKHYRCTKSLAGAQSERAKMIQADIDFYLR